MEQTGVFHWWVMLPLLCQYHTQSHTRQVCVGSTFVGEQEKNEDARRWRHYHVRSKVVAFEFCAGSADGCVLFPAGMAKALSHAFLFTADNRWKGDLPMNKLCI